MPRRARKTSVSYPIEPTFDELRALVAFVDSDGVTAAAETMDVDQSTLSRRLAKFKPRTSNRSAILVSHGKQLRLTTQGQIVIPAVRDLVRQYQQLLCFLNRHADEPQIVRLGLGHFAMQHYLPQVLAALAKKGARLKVEPFIARGEERIAGVVYGDLDLAVVTHNPVHIERIVEVDVPRPVSLAVEPLGRQPFCVAARRNTPEGNELESLPARLSLPLSRLVRWRLVGLDEQSGIRRLLESEIHKKRQSLQFAPGTGTGGWPAAKEYARQGLGVAVLPVAELHTEHMAELVARRLADTISFQDYLIHGPEMLNAVQYDFKQSLCEAARQHEAAMRDKLSALLL